MGLPQVRALVGRAGLRVRLRPARRRSYSEARRTRRRWSAILGGAFANDGGARTCEEGARDGGPQRLRPAPMVEIRRMAHRLMSAVSAGRRVAAPNPAPAPKGAMRLPDNNIAQRLTQSLPSAECRWRFLANRHLRADVGRHQLFTRRAAAGPRFRREVERSRVIHTEVSMSCSIALSARDGGSRQMR